MSVETTNSQPHVIVVPPGSGGSGGLFGRLFGAIIASCLLSGIGYLANYTTLGARLWLKREGATVEMPAEKKSKGSVMERGGNVLSDTMVKIKEQLDRMKESSAGGFGKARETGAKLGKRVAVTVDKKAAEVKALFAHRQEESRKRHEEEKQQLAEQKAQYDEQVEKFLAYYDAQCCNPKCRAPLRTKGISAGKYVGCARCQFRFMAGRARALGPPRPPPFRPSGQSVFQKLFR